jgi:hypothetical protein
MVGVDPLGMADPAQCLQPADVRASEGLGIAADAVDGCVSAGGQFAIGNGVPSSTPNEFNALEGSR